MSCHVCDAADIELVARITNETQETVTVHTTPLLAEQLFLEVQDNQGNAVHPGPPPTPPVDIPVRELAPDDEHRREATLSGFLGDALAPGRYEVRFVFESADPTGWQGRLETPWITFVVRQPTECVTP